MACLFHMTAELSYKSAVLYRLVTKKKFAGEGKKYNSSRTKKMASKKYGDKRTLKATG